VLLNLTIRYCAYADLFMDDFVGPGEMDAALEGKPIEVWLSRGRGLKPGALVRDWLKLIVAEEPVGLLAFDLPALDEP